MKLPAQHGSAVDRPTAVSRVTLLLILAFGAFHLGYAAFIGLSGDEAYYWQWSRHLDWGYYDHPPMVAYLIAAGVQLAGHSEIGVRLLTVVLATIMLFLVYRMTVTLARLMPGRDPDDLGMPARAGLWSVLALMATPLFGVGGFLATPDIPAAFFWTLAIALTGQAILHPRPRYWILAGLSIGFGITSKYSVVLLPAALACVFAFTNAGRQRLRTTGPWLAAAAAFLACLPNFLWQIQHDFVSLTFQLGHGFGETSPHVARPLNWNAVPRFLAGQAGVISPLLFLLYLWVFIDTGRWLRRGNRTKMQPPGTERLIVGLLWVPALLTLAVFTAASLFAKSQTNWPATAYLTLSVLLGIRLADWSHSGGGKKVLAGVAVGMGFLITGYVHLEAAYPLVPYERSVFNKLLSKRALVEWFDSKRDAASGARSALVLAENYRLASLLAFYLPDHPHTDAPNESGSGAQYVYWRQTARPAWLSRAWYLSGNERDPAVANLFAEYNPVGSFLEQRAGVDNGRTYAFYGTLKPQTLPDVASVPESPPSP